MLMLFDLISDRRLLYDFDVASLPWDHFLRFLLDQALLMLELLYLLLEHVDHVFSFLVTILGGFFLAYL
jgi:hypothetical protein